MKPRREPPLRAIVEIIAYNETGEDERRREKRRIEAERRSMSATHVVVEGTLKLDGSLELDSKLNLPPGRVQLIVQPLPELPKDDPFWQMM